MVMIDDDVDIYTVKQTTFNNINDGEYQKIAKTISKTNQYFDINVSNNSEINIDMNANHNNMQNMDNINSSNKVILILLI